MAEQGRLWRSLARRPATLIAASVLGLMLATCFGTLGWSAARVRHQDLSRVREPPSWQHPLGTDELGRDLLARLLFGGAVSLSLGLLAATVAILIGTAYGAIAGYAGGVLDAVMMRLVDLLYALPSLLLLMLLSTALGGRLAQLQFGGAGAVLGAEWSGFLVLAFSIGAVSWLTVARVIRGQLLLLREQQFIDAARAIGMSRARILVVHVAPNLIGPVIVFATLAVPQAILQESFLSFLGIGIQAPLATWGSLAADGARLLNPIWYPWWLLLFPSLTLSMTLMALGILGDGLRDALDPRSSRGR